MDFSQTFNATQKTLVVRFVRDYQRGGYFHEYEITNPLAYGCIDSRFVLWSIRKAIKHFIGFLDYSNRIEFAVCDSVVGIALFKGEIFTNNAGKIRFTLF